MSLEEDHTLDYKLTVLDKLNESLIRYLANQSHRIAFTELILPPYLQLKRWFKQNHGPNNLQLFSHDWLDWCKQSTKFNLNK